MKKTVSLLLAITMMVSFTLTPLLANAETTYWADMTFARNNINSLKNEINMYGYKNSNGDKVLQYYDENYDFKYFISYNLSTDNLNFLANFNDGTYVNMYYTYPNAYTFVQIAFERQGVRASTNIDIMEYNFDDVTFSVKDKYGNYSYSEIQEDCNIFLGAAIEGWNDCLIYNTSFALCNIGFINLCNHAFSETSIKATFGKNGIYKEYCNECGYYEETIYNAINTVKLNKNYFTYNGKVQKPSVIVKDSQGTALKLNKDYTVTYSNAKSQNVGKYTVTIKFKGNYSGTKTIGYHITAASPKTVKLSTNNFVYNGKVQKPSVVAKDSAGNTLVLNKDYTVTYSDANSKALGKYTVTIKFKGNYTGTKTIGYHINPKGTEFVPSSQGGFKAIKNGFTLKWNKQSSQTTGYQIQYATKRDFSNAASVTITNTNTTSYTFKNRAGGTRYYVRIRTYKKANGKTYFSAWNSGTKSVVTLK